MGMPTTMCLYFRGDGATRALNAFRRALGAEAETLIVHPNRDDSGYYGSAEVLNVDTAREAFATARQPFPTLKAYLGVLPPERDQAAPPPGARLAAAPRAGRGARRGAPGGERRRDIRARAGAGWRGRGGATGGAERAQAVAPQPWPQRAPLATGPGATEPGTERGIAA